LEKVNFPSIHLLILCPFRRSFEPESGSTIRIAGYTKELIRLKIDYRFAASVTPVYVPDENFLSVDLPHYFIKLLILHNLLFSHPYFHFLSWPFRLVIQCCSPINRLLNVTHDRLIWAHQENSMATFLHQVYKKRFIYDVHGILDIQRENREGL
jgi:hypothetical protein